MDTSGLLLEQKANGSIIVGYVDYNVDFFGGRDYERFYMLDRENADKLRAYLAERGFSDLLKGLTAAVGSNFSDEKFRDCCEKANVKYEQTSWS